MQPTFVPCRDWDAHIVAGIVQDSKDRCQPRGARGGTVTFKRPLLRIPLVDRRDLQARRRHWAGSVLGDLHDVPE